MFRYKPNHSTVRNRGFTLIELLVVVVIISISIGMVVAAFSSGSDEEVAEEEIIKMQQLLRFAHAQSVVRAQEYGLRFYKTGYRFMLYDEKTKLWIDLVGDKLLRSRKFPEQLELDLYIDQLSVDLLDSVDDDPEVKEEEKESELSGFMPSGKASRQPLSNSTNTLSAFSNQQTPNTVVIKPQVFLLSSSELEPPFELILRVPGSEVEERLRGLPQGEYTRKDPDE
ncbi:hypothetical protein MNBD_GAMMA09-1354 [hydrothermal vent metagenome]|uniref:Type II secretion system protein H n=1 Tax=hydrothermal vent metagenome TaxID=652676 RepID=A0A3B0Y773_9ZZZZ